MYLVVWATTLHWWHTGGLEAPTAKTNTLTDTCLLLLIRYNISHFQQPHPRNIITQWYICSDNFLQNESKNIIPSCLEWNIGSRGNKFIPKKLSLRSNFDLPEGETLGSLQMIFVSIIICRLLWNCKYLKWVSHVCWASPGHKMSCDDNFVKISQFLQFPPKAAPIGDRDFLKIRAEGDRISIMKMNHLVNAYCPLIFILLTSNYIYFID